MKFIESFGLQLKTIEFDAALENELPFMMLIEFENGMKSAVWPPVYTMPVEF